MDASTNLDDAKPENVKAMVELQKDTAGMPDELNAEKELALLSNSGYFIENASGSRKNCKQIFFERKSGGRHLYLFV